MTIRPISNVSYFPFSDDKNGSPRSEISIHGKIAVVSGKELIQAYAFGSMSLVLMSDDYDYDNCINIILFDSKMRPLDFVILGLPFGIPDIPNSSDVSCQQPDTISLAFGGQNWKIRCLRESQFRIPYIPDAPGVKRPWVVTHPRCGFSRHMTISKAPLLQMRRTA